MEEGRGLPCGGVAYEGVAYAEEVLALNAAQLMEEASVLIFFPSFFQPFSHHLQCMTHHCKPGQQYGLRASSHSPHLPSSSSLSSSLELSEVNSGVLQADGDLEPRCWPFLPFPSG